MNSNYICKIISSFTKCECVSEFRFHETRKWRFDFAIPEQKIAIEIEGGIWIQGRHNRASGFVKDMEKYNTAASLGWILIRSTPQNILSTEILNFIKDAIANR